MAQRTRGQGDAIKERTALTPPPPQGGRDKRIKNGAADAMIAAGIVSVKGKAGITFKQIQVDLQKKIRNKIR